MTMFSVIIPAFNVEDYITDCIQSVIAQDFNDFELIIINDGSSDRTLENIKKFTDPRINIYSQSNAGVSCARNLGMKRAVGDYLVFLDADDILTDQAMLSIACEKLTSFDLDILSFNHISFNGSQKWNNKIKRKPEHLYTGREFLLESGGSGLTVMVWDKIYKRKFLMDLNFKFNAGFLYEDNIAHQELMFNSNRVMHINKFFYGYRLEGFSITRQDKFTNLHVDSLIFIVEWLSNRQKNSKDKLYGEYLRKQVYDYLCMFYERALVHDVYRDKLKSCQILTDKVFGSSFERFLIENDFTYLENRVSGLSVRLVFCGLVRIIRKIYYRFRMLISS